MADPFKKFLRAIRPQETPPPRSTKIRRRRKRLRLTGFGLLGAAVSGSLAWGVAEWLRPPSEWIWSLIGFLGVVFVAFIAWWQRHPVRGTWFVAALLGAATALGGYALQATPPERLPIDPNRQTTQRVIQLKQALERRGDYRQSAAIAAFFPPPDHFIAFVLSQPHGDELLISPWGQVPQYQVLKPLIDAGLPNAAERHEGIPAPSLGTEIGPGIDPISGAFTPYTYGAILYDQDPRSGRYVLYGIGRRGHRAIVVAVAEGEP